MIFMSLLEKKIILEKVYNYVSRESLYSNFFRLKVKNVIIINITRRCHGKVCSPYLKKILTVI